MVLRVRGKVVSGSGVGAKFVSMKSYIDIFKSLGIAKPYPGTLNVLTNLSYEDIVKVCKPLKYIHEVRNGYGIHGGLIIWNGKLVRGSDGVNVLVIRPLRSRHGPEVLEVISELYLRGRLLLNDGDDVELIINCC